MAHDADGDLAELVVLVVGQCLRGSDDDALPGVDAEGVEVLHIADRDAVVVAVTDDLVLNLLPALEALLDEHLRGEGEGLAAELIQLLLVVAEATAEPPESIGGADDDGVAEAGRCLACLLQSLRGMALDGLD